MNHRQVEPLGHHVAERHVGDRNVHRQHRCAVLLGRSATGSRSRPHRRGRRGGAHLLDGVGDRIQERRLLDPRHRALALGGGWDLLLGIDGAGEHLGAAEVDPDDAVAATSATIPGPMA